MMVGVASAQQSKSDETLEFRPHWSLRVQGGAAYITNQNIHAISPLNSGMREVKQSACTRFL